MPKTANIPTNQTLSAHNPAHHSWKTSRTPDFLPEAGMQGPSIAEYSQKCTSPPPPHGAKQNKRATFLSGALRRTQEALAARSAQRGLLACPRTRREGTCSLPRQLRQLTRRCKPSCAYPRQHRTGYQSGSRGASSSQDRSRCSQPGRSRSRRRRKPCCRSRQPGR